MDRNTFIVRLSWLAAATAVMAVVLRLLVGQQTFSLYGLAVVALLILPFLVRSLNQRREALGRSSRRALLWALPVVLLAAGQIVYWLLFFSGNPNVAVLLGIVRGVALAKAGPVVAMLPVVAAAPLAWLVLSAARVDDSA